MPVVLQKDDVKTLPREIFDRVDRLAAPRLVEYWEQDPCAPDVLMLPGAPVKKMASTGKGGGCAAGETDAAGGLAGLLGLVWLGRRRRR